MTHLLSVNSYDAAINAEQLGRRFGAHWAVRKLDMAVPRGSVYGFLGLNGAGKSTTIRMLMGLLSPTEGRSTVAGIDPVEDEVSLKRRVGYVPDIPSFYEWMTTREILAFAAHYRRGQWDDKRAAHLVKVFKLPLDQKLRNLSKGQRSKVSLTLALAFNPEVLVLDEPTGGLDPIARRQFIEGVLAEYMDETRTILISSHLINEISGLVDTYGILHEGELIRSGRVEQLLGSMRKIRLFYENGAPRAFAIDGMLRMRVNGREALITVQNFDEAHTPEAMQKLGATETKIEPLTLEEAFVEIVGERESEGEAEEMQ